MCVLETARGAVRSYISICGFNVFVLCCYGGGGGGGDEVEVVVVVVVVVVVDVVL